MKIIHSNKNEVANKQPVQAAVMEWSQPTESKTSGYEQYAKCSYKGSKYSVYFTPALGGEDKAQVSVLKPYDDAEYYWAQLKNGSVQYIQDGKVKEKAFFAIETEDEEIHDEDLNDALEAMIQHLDELNANIEPRIIHDSANIQGQPVQAAQEEFSDDLQDLVEQIRMECKNKVHDIMTGPEFGFSDKEADQYSTVDAIYEDGFVVIEIRAEVDYDGLTQISQAADSVVSYYDPDAYFDPAEPGITNAWLNIDKLNEVAVEGTTACMDIDSCDAVQSSIYDAPEPPLDPPSYPDPDVEEVVDDFVVDLNNCTLMIDEYGYYTINDDNLDFINDATKYTVLEYDWNEKYDEDDIYEILLDKISEIITPDEVGTYTLHGTADFKYDIARDVYHNYYPDGEGEVSDEPEYDNIDVDFRHGECKINNLKYEKIQ